MRTSPLSITIQSSTHQRTQRAKKILVEFDADQFERLAAAFGLFNPEFIKSLDRAEKDYRAGKFWKFKSLRELRSR